MVGALEIVGITVGTALGSIVGMQEIVGATVGNVVGSAVGVAEGTVDGIADGTNDGLMVGSTDGTLVGTELTGVRVGLRERCLGKVGFNEGNADGMNVG